MARLDKTIKDYQKQLKDKGIKNIPEFVQSIVDADLTQGKYSRFLLDCYIDNKFREEDLQGGLESTVGQTISLFHKHKAKLPEDMRSIYKYDSPGSLWNAVKQFDGELSGKELKKELQDKIYSETEFVYEDENTGFRIVTPLTKESAQWWGKGTRWCTSAEKNNMFEIYADQAPLLILFMPGGDKVQLWKTRRHLQFMDASDITIKLDYIRDNWSILEPVMKWIGDLECIPYNFQSEELCMEMVSKYGNNIRHVNNALITNDLLECAIHNEPLSYQFIQDDFKTSELSFLALEKNALNLRFVPKKILTQEMCNFAMLSDKNVFKYIPKEYRTKELCDIEISKNKFNLELIPKIFKTQDVCTRAVFLNPLSLEKVPKNMKTEELCRLAVEKDGSAMQYVPENMVTDELCKLSLQQNGCFLQYFPQDFKTEEFIKLALQQNGQALNRVPKQFKTEENCELAVKNGLTHVEYIPEKLRPLYITSIRKNHQKNIADICNMAEKQLSLIPKVEFNRNDKENYKLLKKQEIYNSIFNEIRFHFEKNNGNDFSRPHCF